MGHDEGRQCDFFVSYAETDKAWAEWVAWTLEAHGFSVVVRAWDAPAGSNWIKVRDAGIRDATRTIAVLSADYLESAVGAAESQAAWAKDPERAGRKLLPVRVSDCAWSGLLAEIVTIDLFGIDEETARGRLLHMIDGAMAGRQKPAEAPGFPGIEPPKPPPPFPGAPARHQPEDPDGDESEKEAEGATVTDLQAFRLRSGRDSAGPPDISLLNDLILELSKLAESAGASYQAGSQGYVWTRLELGRRLPQITAYLQQVTQWLARAGLADDLSTFDLEHFLRQYPGKAEKFTRTLGSLEHGQSPSRQRVLLAGYEAAWQSLRDLLWQIYREFSIAGQPPEPTGLR